MTFFLILVSQNFCNFLGVWQISSYFMAPFNFCNIDLDPVDEEHTVLKNVKL